MAERSGSTLSILACVAGGAILLVAAAMRPPVGTCDPPIGIAHALFAGAQVLGLAALVQLRRRGLGDGTAATTALAWAASSGVLLVMRSTAGDLAAFGQDDLVYGVGGALGLFLLMFGLAAKLRDSGTGSVVAATLLAFAVGLGAPYLADGVVRVRLMQTWERLQQLDVAVASARGAGAAPEAIDVPIDDVLAALTPTWSEGLETRDAWGRPFLYTADDVHYAVSSRGAHGAPGPYSWGPSRDYVDDLVMRDGMPHAWPEVPCRGGDRQSKTPPPEDMRQR